MAIRQTNNVIEFLKIRRGGERFWVRVVGRDGQRKTVRVDSETTDPRAPRFGTEFELPEDEEILDSMRAANHSLPPSRPIISFASSGP